MLAHGLLAIPEAENLAGDELIGRVQAIADELARQQAVDWEAVLESGSCPALALGAERRSSPR